MVYCPRFSVFDTSIVLDTSCSAYSFLVPGELEIMIYNFNSF